MLAFFILALNFQRHFQRHYYHYDQDSADWVYDDPFKQQTQWSSFSNFLGIKTTTTPIPLLQNPFSRCSTHYRTLGLLGTYNGDEKDELTSPDCFNIHTSYPQTEADAQKVYYMFGEKCK